MQLQEQGCNSTRSVKPTASASNCISGGTAAAHLSPPRISHVVHPTCNTATCDKTEHKGGQHAVGSGLQTAESGIGGSCVYDGVADGDGVARCSSPTGLSAAETLPIIFFGAAIAAARVSAAERLCDAVRMTDMPHTTRHAQAAPRRNIFSSRTTLLP